MLLLFSMLSVLSVPSVVNAFELTFAVPIVVKSISTTMQNG